MRSCKKYFSRRDGLQPMRVMAIDPGNEQSAYVIYDSISHEIHDKGKALNDKVLAWIEPAVACEVECVVIEMIASYGMPVGATVFDTCVWIGRFYQVAAELCPVTLLYRREVKMHLCGKTTANDSHIRQSIIDMFPPTGGGKTPQIGIKAKPGPLYGCAADEWAALGVALTFCSIDPLIQRKETCA